METFSKSLLAEQRLLVVAPHADDETAGAGGLVARVKDAGGKAYVMVVSTGDLDHFNRKDDLTQKSLRREELAEAMKALEVDDWEILMEDDTMHLRLETLPRRDLVNLIERKGKLAAERTKPTMIVLPAPSFNQDHEAVYKAGITACRPHLATMKAFQSFVLVADAPQLAWSGPPHFRPNFYVDISGPFLERKLKAFACHRSQLRPDPSMGGLDALRLLAKNRGREISVAAAEAFECYRFAV
ncbi:MAG: PIG-L deacetylase family protein [Planctomycetota bacterium]|jgi:LmbE family N-acetylglucosaminyl deacetylase